MKRLGSWCASLAAGCMAVGCIVATTGCVSSFNWPARFGPRASTQEQLDTQLSLARLSERHGQNDQARRIYEAVLEKSPKNQVAHHRLGVMAARQTDYAKAEQHFARAAEVAPPTADLLTDMAYNLYLQDRLVEAEQVLRQAVQRDPESKRAHNNLGLVLGELGRNDESLVEFRLAVSEAEAHSNLAYARSQAGDVRTAEQQFHAALALDNSLRPTAEALLDLAKMRATLENADGARSQVADNSAQQSGTVVPTSYNATASRRPTAAARHESAARATPSAPKVVDWRDPITSVSPESGETGRVATKVAVTGAEGTSGSAPHVAPRRQTRSGDDSYRVALASDESAHDGDSKQHFPVITPRRKPRGGVSVSLSDKKDTTSATARTAEYDASGEPHGKAGATASVSRESPTRRVSWDGDLNAAENALSDTSEDEDGADSATSIHATTNPWQRPTWTPTSAAASGQPTSKMSGSGETTETMTSRSVLTTPAKTVSNPYTLLPQR